MSLQPPRRSHRQLVRLLQTYLAVEEMRAARATEIESDSTERGEDVQAVLAETAERATSNCDRLERLVERLDAQPVPRDAIQQIVEARYESGDCVESTLGDLLSDAEAAFELSEELVETVEDFDAVSGLDSQYLHSVLTELRAEERQDVRQITELAEREG